MLSRFEYFEFKCNHCKTTKYFKSTISEIKELAKQGKCKDCIVKEKLDKL
jgi:hypothetical protein